jgi:hypothetical protein
MSEAASDLVSEASVPISAPSRYLGQLCKHFQHKVPVTLDEHHGRIEFPAGRCELDAPAGAGTLHMRVVATDRSALAALEDVLTRHLVRFAFREKLDVDWRQVS